MKLTEGELDALEFAAERLEARLVDDAGEPLDGSLLPKLIAAARKGLDSAKPLEDFGVEEMIRRLRSCADPQFRDAADIIERQAAEHAEDVHSNLKLQDEIERQAAEIARHEATALNLQEVIISLEKAQAEIGRLREALYPFARAYDQCTGAITDIKFYRDAQRALSNRSDK